MAKTDSGKRPRSKAGQQKERARSKAGQQKELEFDFIKSNFFRVIHADGAFGGLAPSGNIHMALYSERRPIPTKMVHSIEGGHLGPEIMNKRQERTAMVREVEVDVVLNIPQALTLRDWLTDKIKAFEQLTAIQVAEKPTVAKSKTRK